MGSQQQGAGLEENMGPVGAAADARPHINQHNHFFHFDGESGTNPRMNHQLDQVVRPNKIHLFSDRISHCQLAAQFLSGSNAHNEHPGHCSGQ